ncbi:MAG: hypothetical protein ACRD3R_01010 [Terriglobales bacterium]
MWFLRGPLRLLLLPLLLIAAAASPAAGGEPRDAMCTFFDAVLKEAPTSFAALRGKPMEGYTPMWEGKLKAPGATSCEVSETGYSCSLGARPMVAKGKQEFQTLTRRVAGCYPGWKVTRNERDTLSWSWNIRSGNNMISVEYVDITAMGDEEEGSSGPEIVVGVWVMTE